MKQGEPIDEDFDHEIEYICQYDKEWERLVAVSVCKGKYDFEGLVGHNIKESEWFRLKETK